MVRRSKRLQKKSRSQVLYEPRVLRSSLRVNPDRVYCYVGHGADLCHDGRLDVRLVPENSAYATASTCGLKTFFVPYGKVTTNYFEIQNQSDAQLKNLYQKSSDDLFRVRKSQASYVNNLFHPQNVENVGAFASYQKQGLIPLSRIRRIHQIQTGSIVDLQNMTILDALQQLQVDSVWPTPTMVKDLLLNEEKLEERIAVINQTFAINYILEKPTSSFMEILTTNEAQEHLEIWIRFVGRLFRIAVSDLLVMFPGLHMNGTCRKLGCVALKAHKFFDAIKVAVCPLKRPWDIDWSTVSYLSNGIPKLIHQTWKDDNIPEHWAPGSKAWTSLHPDWLQCLWTDDDLMTYILEKHADFWPVFSRQPQQIQRVDAIRYFILKDIGGLYSDLDLMPNQNISTFLEEADADCFLVKSANEPCQTNMFMAARSPSKRAFKDCLWDRMIRKMKQTFKEPKWYFLVSKHFHVMMTTGPLALTQAADEYTHPIAVLPKLRWNPFGILDAGDIESQELFKQPVLQVLEGSSWHAWDSTAINFLLRYKWWLVTVLAIVLVLSTLGAVFAQNHTLEIREKLRNKFKNVRGQHTPSDSVSVC